MYFLTANFLYVTDLAVTSLEFKVDVDADNISLTLDLNERTYLIVVPEDTQYSDLPVIPGLTIRTDAEVIDKICLLNKYTTIINGLKYYFLDEIKNLSCYISSEVAQSLSIANNSLLLVISPNNLEMTSEDYITLLQSSGLLVLETVDEELFSVTNIPLVNVKSNLNLQFSDTTIFDDVPFSITSTDIVNSFLNTLRSLFNTYSIVPELAKLDVKSKRDILLYSSGVAIPCTTLTGRIERDVDTGKYLRVNIPMSLEYLTDDLSRWESVRSNQLLEKDLFSFRVFNVTDLLETDWKCIVLWEYEFSPDLMDKPITKDFEGTNLYSLPLKCELIGYIVEGINPFEAIETIISNLFLRKDLIQVILTTSDGSVKEFETSISDGIFNEYKSMVTNEIPIGDKNSINRLFYIRKSRIPDSSMVYLNGQRLTVDVDYTEILNGINMEIAPNSTDILTIDYTTY